MAMGVLVEALLPGGGGAISGGGASPPPKDEKGLKGLIRNKLKALASLIGKLGMKAAEALPGIIGGIISWILNRAKDVVGWVSQNLWALVVGIGGLIYTYMVTRNNKKQSHTQLDSRKQVIAFQDRVITINIKEAQHPLK